MWRLSAHRYENAGRSLLASILLGALALLLSAPSVIAQRLGPAEEAKAMLNRAIVALKSDEAIALGEFNDPDNKRFRDRDLYIFCYKTSDGVITAYSSPALLGIDIRTLDLDGDPIGKRAYDGVMDSPPGTFATIDYNFPKPGATASAPMQFLETRLGDEACGISYYK
jgi:hypothetical protein